MPAVTRPRPARAAVLGRYAGCTLRGGPTGETRPCAECGGQGLELPLLFCSLHGVCTESRRAQGVPCCLYCTDRVAPPRPPMRWVSTGDLARDAVRLAAMLPPDCSAVAGIPRSGMMPATIVATHLHLPLYELARGGTLRPLAAGSRGGSLYRRAGPVAVVDDTVYGGGAMRRGRAAMAGRPAVFCAVYVRPEAAAAVDLYAAELRCPHLLEWNLPNNGPFWGAASADTAGVYGSGVACDLDGVIVHDEQSGGPPGTPYLIPRAHPVRLIVTGRRERHRAETEALLRKWGVRWERLEMLPDDTPMTPYERLAAEHKARHYGQSGCGFFMESCPVQAEMIFGLAKRPVINPVTGKVWQ